MNQIRELQATDVSAIVIDRDHAHINIIGSENVTITMHRTIFERLGREIASAIAKVDYEEKID